MPRERLKKDRLRQVFNWLEFKYPTPFPLRLRCLPRKNFKSESGYAELRGGKLIICLNMGIPLYILLDTLIHEMAHCRQWPSSRMAPHVQDHSNEWGISYAEMYRDFYDGSGDAES